MDSSILVTLSTTTSGAIYATVVRLPEYPDGEADSESDSEDTEEEKSAGMIINLFMLWFFHSADSSATEEESGDQASVPKKAPVPVLPRRPLLLLNVLQAPAESTSSSLLGKLSVSLNQLDHASHLLVWSNSVVFKPFINGK